MFKMWFKVGISLSSPVIDAEGRETWKWSSRYELHLLPADSTLSDVPVWGNHPDVMEMMGLREDQPEYDSVSSYEDLCHVFAQDERIDDIMCRAAGF